LIEIFKNCGENRSEKIKKTAENQQKIECKAANSTRISTIQKPTDTKNRVKCENKISTIKISTQNPIK
jgi:hypothetical protein